MVATVKSLDGQRIEPYANELFRAWKLGEKAKNNGVLLLVAPNERKVRIEVGYGLEGTLTDALSKIIITNAIAPRFKAGDFAGGIERGVEDIITTLTADAGEWQPEAQAARRRGGSALDGLCAVPPVRAVHLHVLDDPAQLRRGSGRRSGAAAVRSSSRPGAVVGWGSGSSSAEVRRAERRLGGRLLGRRRLVGRRRRIGGLVMAISRKSATASREAIRAAERDIGRDRLRAGARLLRTTPMCRSCGRRFLALALPWPLIVFTSLSARAHLPAADDRLRGRRAVLSIPRLRMLFVPRAIQRARAHHAAVEQFMSRGLTREGPHRRADLRVAGRTLRAHHRRRPISRPKCPPETGEAAVDALVAHVREGRLADGFVAAIGRCGAVLAEHAPGAHRGKLPDRIYLV